MQGGQQPRLQRAVEQHTPQQPTLAPRQRAPRTSLQHLQRPRRLKTSWPAEQLPEILPPPALSSLSPELQLFVTQQQHQRNARDVPQAVCELSPAAITAHITRCNSWHDAAVLFAQQAPCLNHIHLSALLVRLAHLPAKSSSTPANWRVFLQRVLAVSEPLLHQAEPRHLAMMSWALAKLGLDTWIDGICTTAAAAVLPYVRNTSIQQLQQQPKSGPWTSPHDTSSISSNADPCSDDSMCHPGSWGLSWQHYVITNLHAASCRDVSNVLWALATSADRQLKATAGQPQQHLTSQQQQKHQHHQYLQLHQHSAFPQPAHYQQHQQQQQQVTNHWCSSLLLQELLSALHRTLPNSTPQDVANAAWALATLHVQPSAELASFLLIRVQAHFSSLKPCEVATTLWALSVLRVTPSGPWLEECLLRQVGQPQWQQTHPGHWVMCLLACARLGQVPPTAWLVECLQQQQAAMVQLCSAQSTCTPPPPPQQHPQQQQHSQQHSHPLEQQQQQQFRGPLQGVVACGFIDVQQQERHNSSISSSSRITHTSRNNSKHSSSGSGSSGSGVCPDAAEGRCLIPQDLANCMWALAKLRIKPNPVWMSHYLSASAVSLAAASPEELVNCIWGLQVLGVVPDGPWLSAFDAASLSCMSGFSPQGLGNILAAQVRLGLKPSAAWCEAWAAALKASWRSADASAVCTALWAAAKCEIPLGRAWLNRGMRAVHAYVLLPALAAQQLSPEELLRLVWAVGRLCRGLMTRKMSNVLGLYCCKAAGKMTGAQLARGAWGLARLVPLPRVGLLQHFHDLAASKVRYLTAEDAVVLEQRLALLRDAVDKAEQYGTHWRSLMHKQVSVDDQTELVQHHEVVGAGSGR